MLVGQTAGIVVANHTEELESLRKSKTHHVYFADATHAGGIIEGLHYFGLTNGDDIGTRTESDDLEDTLVS
jgi:sucrose-phosphate synthase